MRFKNYTIAISCFWVFSISMQAKPHTLENYNENLSVHRTKFTSALTEEMTSIVPKLKNKKKTNFPIEHDITQQLTELLIDLKSYYEMTDLISGYTIQAYTGSNRQLAFQIRDQLFEAYPNSDVEVKYKQPNFIVRVGRFLDRLEAYEFYVGIKKMLPQSIIRPTQFPNRIDTFDALHKDQVNDPIQNTEPIEQLVTSGDNLEERRPVQDIIEKE